MINAALERAVEIAGGQSELARRIGKKQAHIWNWLHKQKIPAEVVLDIERETGISRHDLRPDVFGKPKDGAPNAEPTAKSGTPRRATA